MTTGIVIPSSTITEDSYSMTPKHQQQSPPVIHLAEIWPPDMEQM